MELLTYIVVFAVGFYIAWHIRGIVFMANIAERPEKVIKMLEEIKRINEQEAKGTYKAGIEVEPEKVGPVWYAYAKENGQFLAQGPTLEEAMRLASIRFPNKEFWCNTLASNLTKPVDDK